MKRALLVILFATAGLVIPLLAAFVADRLHTVPQFPAFAGEDDFTLRAGVFFLCVVPAFAAIGGWIGYACGGDLLGAARAWLGVLGGSVVTFVVVRASAHWIERLATRDASNLSAVAFFVAWTALAGAGAWLALRAPFTRDKRGGRDG